MCTTSRASRCGRRATIASSAAVTPLRASTMSSARSARSISFQVRSIPRRSTSSAVSRRPAVSTTFSGTPSIWIACRTESRVVPGTGVTIASSSPASRLSRLDLPTFGWPASTTCRPERSRLPCCARASVSVERAAQPLEPAAGVGAVQRIDLLLGEVERSLGERAQLDQLIDERADRAGELAAQAAHRAPRGGLGRRVDHVGDRFGLREVELVVEKGAARELAGLREPRAELERAAQQHREDERAAVALELEHVLAGVGMRRGEVERDAVVDRRAVRVEKDRARRAPRGRHLADQVAGEAGERPAGDPNDADPGAAMGRCDCRDRVGGRRHARARGRRISSWRRRASCRPRSCA